MVGKFAGILILVSVIYSLVSGNISDVSAAVLNEPVNAVELAVYLCGGMCFWSGLMRVAEKSGVTEIIAGLLKKPLKALFSDIDTEGRAFRCICMNVSANLLGLGNAATPLGIEAMKALSEESDGALPSDNMVIFTVLNTASLTLIPTTAASLRLKYGAERPFDIMPAVIFTTAASLTVSLIAAKAGCALGKLGRKHERKRGESLG